MKDVPNASAHPVAKFVVERIAGTGYCVTSSSGPECSALQKDAMTLLDKVKQTNAESDDVTCEWIGPIGPKGYFVGVTTVPTTDGELRYKQSWFAGGKRQLSIVTYVAGMILSLVVGMGVGAVAANLAVTTVDAPGGTPASDPRGLQAQENTDTDLERPADETAYDDLRTEIVATEELRAKMGEYLQQEGLAADPSLPVIEEHRSVKIIADLDRSPPQRESIRLSNVEVLALLKLLERLDKFEANLKNGTND